MNDYSTVVGLDVHKDTVVAAILHAEGARPTETVRMENTAVAVERLVRRVSAKGRCRFVYEAGPCGYEIQRQTDRRDAEKLARLFRAGELSEIHIPSREEEAARDLVRIREDALEDRLRARHRLLKFLLRQGRVFRETANWSKTHQTWLQSQRFDFEPLQQTLEGYLRALEDANVRLSHVEQQVRELCEREPYRTHVRHLRCLKGIESLSAITLAVEARDFQRFETARAFMAYTGAVPSEHSSGGSVRRGRITRTGNAHIRRILIESAWGYRGRDITSADVAKRREGCPPEIVAIARRAQSRLHRKFWRLTARGKENQKTAVAVARELSGFIWAIARFPLKAATA